MRIWTLNVGEPLPIDAGTWRPWRVGVTTRILAERGHDVTWWSSTMNHHDKTQRCTESTEKPLFDEHPGRSRLILLHGRHYGRNLSWQRIVNHRQIALEFRRLAATCPRPDVIFCALPTLELAREAVRFGQRNGVPVILDIRDQWPDFMVELFPRPLRSLARLGLEFMYRDLREACRGAAGITGNAPALVNWGVRFADRPEGPRDRFFAHGYPRMEYGQEDLARARAFWDDLGIPADDDMMNIIFIGSVRFTVIDFETVLEAFAPLQDQARLIIAGSGDDLDRLKKKASHLRNVVFAGWVDGPAIKVLMGRGDVGLAPYRNSDNFKDSLPNKFVEYMSEALPIVSSLEGFSRHLLQEHGCAGFFREGDPGSLTATLRGLQSDPESRRHMGQRAQALYMERYSAEKLYGELADFLEELAAEV